MATDRPLVLLWIPDAAPYRQGLARAGLDQRVEVVSVPLGETPKPELLARCEAMLAFRAGAGVLAQMPRLRWLQALTAGVEGWLALPDLPKGLTLTCARGTHRVQMPENILGALFHLTKPYAGIVEDQKQRHWRRRVSTTLAGTTLGILGLGVIGQELARKAEALEMRVIGTRRSPAPMPHVERVYGPADTDTVLAAADFVLLLLPVTPETRGFMNAARLKRMKPGAYLLNFGRGARRLHHRAAARRASLLGHRGHHGAAAHRRAPSRPRSHRGRALHRQPAALPRGPAAAGDRGPRARLLARR